MSAKRWSGETRYEVCVKENNQIEVYLHSSHRASSYSIDHGYIKEQELVIVDEILESVVALCSVYIAVVMMHTGVWGKRSLSVCWKTECQSNK